ncbi:hypothetical protein, variant 2 [Cladophialophora immunda]|uniref:Cytochrome P450 n=1 Tax=Cladophialophora immunda TaxID=569365 RepID=A0A0D1ZKE1_9EURO|nr:uncharacterized protein PV07_08122 [Cladophialophora immunda]XP_016248673.1 hypothetical protein, variant 1 [Cladophialophora immunda]XP_016248674.1 hypothetical protein, variant 2 [Cladophialophora immunda]KIW28456.1 hypothetical protein PV07_08122 [Cladophialophora immunda]KIW28457.1 hypothetical protein, variant 1 [Cladophialophora immunda]KIW28458.1 hypothetical protein, variant 2 [Cladophialophora immunda]
MAMSHVLQSVPIPALQTPSLLHILLSVPLLIGATCLLTWLLTTIQFSLSVKKFRALKSGRAATQAIPTKPPVLPYAIPWLGHAWAFLNENPGSFWRTLQMKLDKTGTNLQFCTVLLAGQRVHITNSATAVQALFRSRQVSRELFNRQIAVDALGCSKRDAEIMFPPTPGLGRGHGNRNANATTTDAAVPQEEEKDKRLSMDAINHEFLLHQTAANALTNKFMAYFTAALDGATEVGDEWTTIDLLAWLKKIMFEASTTALLGTKILEMNPDLAEQFWAYDATFLARFYGLPKLVKPGAYACLETILDRTAEWVEAARAECGGNPPEEPDWEPLFGSKVMRARHRFYERRGLSSRGRAAFDIGFLFAVSSNVIPITSWLLAHILSPMTPKDTLTRIQGEVERAKRPDDGTVDISALLTQPLLNSAVHETMRHYLDLLVTRQLTTDTVLDGYLLKKGELIMAPTSFSHHDPRFWDDDHHRHHRPQGSDGWDAERFLRRDPDTGRETSTTSWAAGKFFPFGGGAHACPGRVFARQEILGAVATLLTRFEVRFVEYVSTDGANPAGFPRVRRQYAGNGALNMDGDIRVEIRRR